MAHPVVLDITLSKIPAAAPANSFVWDARFTVVISTGRRFDFHRGFGTNAAGMTGAQVKAAIMAIATGLEDTLVTNPPAPVAKDFPGVWDAVLGTEITDPNDPDLPPGVTLALP